MNQIRNISSLSDETFALLMYFTDNQDFIRQENARLRRNEKAIAAESVRIQEQEKCEHCENL